MPSRESRNQRAWMRDPFLFTLALLWMRREPVTDATPRARWCGLAILGLGLAMRVAGSYFNYAITEYPFTDAYCCRLCFQ